MVTILCPRCGEDHEVPLKSRITNNSEAIIKCPKQKANVTVKIKIYASTEFEEREGATPRKIKVSDSECED